MCSMTGMQLALQSALQSHGNSRAHPTPVSVHPLLCCSIKRLGPGSVSRIASLAPNIAYTSQTLTRTFASHGRVRNLQHPPLRTLFRGVVVDSLNAYRSVWAGVVASLDGLGVRLSASAESRALQRSYIYTALTWRKPRVRCRYGPQTFTWSGQRLTV